MAINRERRSAPIPIITQVCDVHSVDDALYRRWDYEKLARSRGSQICGSPKDDNKKTKKMEARSQTKGTQTDYRESETQTLPWEAPYKLRSRTDENPEILSLTKSTWGNGLPAGMHEVEIINRMRMKRAWLAALPPMNSASNVKINEVIRSAIEANEWAFREAEIQFLMDLRMELMEHLMENRNKIKKEKVNERMEMLTKRLSQQRDKQIHDIRGKFRRELRKLTIKHRATNAASFKKHLPDIITRYADAKSQLYGPLLRMGSTPESRHEVLNKELLRETYVDGTIQIDDARKWLPTDQQLRNIKPQPKPDELCIRQTRWTEEKLRELHADLKAIRLNSITSKRRDKPTLLKRKYKVPAMPVTPTITGDNRIDDDMDSCSQLSDKIMKGKAIQTMMFQGRERCRKLIEELKTIQAFDDTSDESIHDDSSSELSTCYEENEKDTQENRLSEVLDSLEGLTVSGMLDTLSKEDTRLREERRAHAITLLAERERNRREAEESGRRQLEYNRRCELDEMFRQVVRVNQESVESYLEDVVREGIDWVSNDEANRLANKAGDIQFHGESCNEEEEECEDRQAMKEEEEVDDEQDEKQIEEDYEEKEDAVKGEDKEKEEDYEEKEDAENDEGEDEEEKEEDYEMEDAEKGEDEEKEEDYEEEDAKKGEDEENEEKEEDEEKAEDYEKEEAEKGEDVEENEEKEEDEETVTIGETENGS